MELQPLSVSEPLGTVPFAAVRISGADATRYLQGQVTQDLSRIPEGSGSLSILPTVEGKLLTTLYLIHAGPGSWRALLPTPHLEQALDRLKRFKLRVSVEFSVEWEVSAPDPASDPSPWWPLGPGMAPAAEAVNLERFTYARLERGAFYLPSDAGPGLLSHAVPGLVPAAVSFTKGCYVGQELINRTDSRGAPPPEVLRIADLKPIADAPSVALGPEPLLCRGEEAGTVTALAAGPGFSVAALRIKRRFASEPYFEFATGAGLAAASVRR